MRTPARLLLCVASLALRFGCCPRSLPTGSAPLNVRRSPRRSQAARNYVTFLIFRTLPLSVTGVRFGSLATVRKLIKDVRFSPKTDMLRHQCLVSAISRVGLRHSSSARRPNSRTRKARRGSFGCQLSSWPCSPRRCGGSQPSNALWVMLRPRRPARVIYEYCSISSPAFSSSPRLECPAELR